QVDALVTTGDEKSSPAIQLLPVGPNQFAVRGKVPVGGKPQVRIYPVEEPALFARALFVEALRRAGVKANAAVLRPAVVNLPAKGPEWEAYKAARPVLGVDGTLAEAVGESSPARGKARGKTGTLIWFDAANERFLLKSKAIAGTMTTKAGTELFFAMIVNNVPL